MPKILIIRFSSIGDIVLASPAFRCLRQQMENAEIHFLTKASFSPVTIANPYIDKFFYLASDLSGVLNRLKAEQYDFVIDLHKNLRSNKVVRHLGCKTYSIRKLNLQKFFLTKFNIDFMPGRHITRRSIDTLSELNIKDDGGGLDYFISPEDKVSQTDIPTSHSAGFVAIAIGANHMTKKLPPDKLRELCKKINHPLVLLGGKEDFKIGAAVALDDEIKIYNACGKFNLNESADLIRRSKLLISHDTGLLYIACALKKPVIAIWGGTSPALDVEPYYGGSFQNPHPFPIYENILLNLSCQPCSKYGTSKCPLEHFNCMHKQNIDLISEMVHFRLRSL